MNKKSLVSGVIKMIMPDRYFDDIYVSKMLTRENLHALSAQKLIWCFIHGFLPHEYLLYDLDKNDYREYVPARNSLKNRKLCGRYNTILGNKIVFEKHMENVISGIDGLYTIKNLAFIEKGFLQSLSENVASGNFNSLLPILEKNDLILKPVTGDGGVGLYMISKKNGDFSFRGTNISWGNLCHSLQQLDNMLIQERFIQHGFSHDLYPESVNTIRIATMLDPSTNEPFIGFALHRFGSPVSGFVDNTNQGGLYCLIDDGRLTKLVNQSHSGEKKFFDYHPNSNKKITGEQVPGWDRIVERVLEMARRMPYLTYIGWDLILSDDDLYVLEGNVSPGTTFQLYKPMKQFPAWEFYRYYNYC